MVYLLMPTHNLVVWSVNLNDKTSTWFNKLMVTEF